MTYREKTRRRIIPSLFASMLLILNLSHPTFSQNVGSTERGYARTMLWTIKEDIKKSFYDPNFRGVDIEARFKDAEAKIQQARSQGQLNGIIGQFMLQFDDPNTLFISSISFRLIDYGWDWMMVGNKCYVTAVKPGSDAEAKGLKVGDEVLFIGGNKPTRETAWKIKYGFFMVRPQSMLQVAVQRSKNPPQQLEIRPELTLSGNRIGDSDIDRIEQIFIKELGSEKIEVAADLMVWKLFGISDDEQIGEAMKKARKYKSLIIDLRGCSEHIKGEDDSNYGAKKLQELISYMFDRDVKVGDIKNRKERKPLLAKARNNQAFTGNVAVLINSETSSIAEVFARIIQLEKRGIVVGDRSQGATRLRSWHHHGIELTDSLIPYSISVPDRELITSDGESLDGVGVTPDVVVLPTAEDLANNYDPVLSLAAEKLGAQISPAKAGSILKRRQYTLWLK